MTEIELIFTLGSDSSHSSGLEVHVVFDSGMFCPIGEGPAIFGRLNVVGAMPHVSQVG